MSLFMATHPSKTLFKPTASAGGSLWRSKACKRHDRTSPEMLQTAANCCKLLQTASEDHHKTYYVCACGHVHQCLNAYLFFRGIDNNEILQGVLLRFYSPDFETQLWLMLALTLFKATALAWAAATSTLPGVFSTSTCKKKAKLEDCLHSESQCFTCTMLHLTAFQGGSSFPFRSALLERRVDDWW